MSHIMFDLETIGNTPRAPIVQIAAARFDIRTGEIFSEFNQFVNHDGGIHPFVMDFPTVKWWLNQSKEAQNQVFSEPGDQVLNVLSRFNVFCMEGVSNPRHLRIWSHATFDPPILMNHFQAVGLRPDFHFKAFMDIRTLAFLSDYTHLKPRESYGVAHDGIADCRFQVDYVSGMYRRLMGATDDSFKEKKL